MPEGNWELPINTYREDNYKVAANTWPHANDQIRMLLCNRKRRSVIILQTSPPPILLLVTCINTSLKNHFVFNEYLCLHIYICRYLYGWRYLCMYVYILTYFHLSNYILIHVYLWGICFAKFWKTVIILISFVP